MRLIGGGYAEYSSVAARQCRVIPRRPALTEAALAEPPTIGLLVAFWARRMGTAHVVMADLHDHQKANARR